MSSGSVFSGAFWKAALERALNTFLQFLVGVWGVNGITSADLDWGQTLAGAGIAAGVSVIKSLIVATATDGGPSIGNVETVE